MNAKLPVLKQVNGVLETSSWKNIDQKKKEFKVKNNDKQSDDEFLTIKVHSAELNFEKQLNLFTKSRTEIHKFIERKQRHVLEKTEVEANEKELKFMQCPQRM
jgi:hypothetical protein